MQRPNVRTKRVEEAGAGGGGGLLARGVWCTPRLAVDTDGQDGVVATELMTSDLTKTNMIPNDIEVTSEHMCVSRSFLDCNSSEKLKFFIV